MKKTSITLSILSALFGTVAAVLFFLLPNFSSVIQALGDGGFVNSFLHHFGEAFLATITFAIGRPIYSSILCVMLALVVIFWLWHFIMLCTKRRADSFIINLFWFLFGLTNSAIALIFLGYRTADTGYVFVGTVDGASVNDGIQYIQTALGNTNVDWASLILPIVVLSLAALSYLLGLIGVMISIHDDRKNPKQTKKEGESKAIESQAKPEEGERAKTEEGNKPNALEEAQKQELDAMNTATQGVSPYPSRPLIVQNISYGGMTGAPLSANPYAYLPKEDNKPVTAEEIKAILSDLLSERSTEKKEEEPSSKIVTEERPLTAKELRSIIQNELQDHDHPEELLPLTDEQCRRLIREELDDYYSNTRPLDEKEQTKEEKASLSPIEETKPEESDEDYMTAEDLGKMIHDEVVQAIGVQKKEEEPKISEDQIRSIVKEELSISRESLEKQNESISEIKQQAIQAEYEAKLASAKSESMAEDLKKSQLTAEEIRSIVSSVLEERLSHLSLSEQPILEERKEEPVAPFAPRPIAEAKPTETAQEPRRIPFANRIMGLDQEAKDNYNKLKAEALSYGLKSRLSISGDTFRLHTKTYLKIIVAGKGLKIYLALDPHDYKDTTIPIKDVGIKNVYKDIPLAFKVKSPLSLKRAKQLIKDVCEKDGLKQGEIPTFNYVAQLESYRVAGSEEKEEEE